MGLLPYPAHNLAPQAVPKDKLPKPAKLEGPFARNELLRDATRLFDGKVCSESVNVDSDGWLWLLDKYSYIYVAAPPAQGSSNQLQYELDPRPLCYIGPGCPLGFEFDKQGNLIICDALKGLLMLEKVGGNSSSSGTDSGSSSSSGGGGPKASKWRLRTLSNIANGYPVGLADDLDIASDGRIYFSDATIIPTQLNYAEHPWYDAWRTTVLAVAHGKPTGRLLVYNPADDTTEEVLTGIYFANGVALAPDESFVAVVESVSMRVLRRWLTGPKAGTVDTLIDSLPGLPDNICRSEDGNFWLSLVAPDQPILHKMLPRKWMRSLYAKLPEWLLPKQPEWGCVLKVSPAGEVLQVLMDADGRRVSHVADVKEHQGLMFLSNLKKDYVSVLDLATVEGKGKPKPKPKEGKPKRFPFGMHKPKDRSPKPKDA